MPSGGTGGDGPSQASRRQPGRCYADALRSPPREVEQNQNRERNRTGENRSTGVEEKASVEESRTVEVAEGPTLHVIGGEESDVEEQDDVRAEADPGLLTAKNLAARIRNLEAKKEKRERKVLKQRQAIDEQNEVIEEEHRKLNTLVFELADTREDIAAIDSQIREASRLHSELNAARGDAHGFGGGDNDDEGDEHRVSAIVHQVLASMRVNGRLRANTLQKFLSSLMHEADLVQDADGPREEERKDSEAKRARLPSRSPAPRTPQGGVGGSAEASSAQTAASSSQPAPNQSSDVCRWSPPKEPTVQMRQQAQAALLSDQMWQDEVVSASAEEAISGAMVAVASGPGPVLPATGATVAAALGPGPGLPVLPVQSRPPLRISRGERATALAICDRPASEPRGRRIADDAHSPARSRDRKDLYRELNAKVVSQRQAANRGRPS